MNKVFSKIRAFTSLLVITSLNFTICLLVSFFLKQIEEPLIFLKDFKFCFKVFVCFLIFVLQDNHFKVPSAAGLLEVQNCENNYD